MVPNVGIQLSNTTLDFGIKSFNMRKENATHYPPEGGSEEWGMVKKAKTYLTLMHT